MDTSKRYKQAPNCLTEDMDGEYLLYNPDTATTLHLNQPSMLIWELCDGDATLGDIVEELRQGFPAQAEQIENDVYVAVQGLIDQKVLVVSD